MTPPSSATAVKTLVGSSEANKQNKIKFWGNEYITRILRVLYITSILRVFFYFAIKIGTPKRSNNHDHFYYYCSCGWLQW